MNANDRVSDDIVNLAVRLERVKKQTLGKILALLREVDKDISARIVAEDLTSFQARRINALSRDIRDMLVEVYAASQGIARESAEQVAEAQINGAVKALDDAVGATFASRPTLVTVYSAALARPYQGKLLREYYRDLPLQLADRVRSQIRIGYVSGETTTQIVSRVRKILKGQAVNFNRTIINTTLSHFSGAALMATYQANSDALSGVIWDATLDTRTSDFCKANDGRFFELDKTPVYPNHMNERSTLKPVLKRWQELGIEPPVRTRASLDGQIPENIDYRAWISRQSFTRQVEALGRRRAELLRDGMPVDRLFTKNGLVSIAQLEANDKLSA